VDQWRLCRPFRRLGYLNDCLLRFLDNYVSPLPQLLGDERPPHTTGSLTIRAYASHVANVQYIRYLFYMIYASLALHKMRRAKPAFPADYEMSGHKSDGSTSMASGH
jgi:hypothetical protein